MASDALKRHFASNPVDQDLIQTIEITNPAFDGGALRFADWGETLRLRTDSGWHDFYSSSVSAPYPDKGVRGAQDINLQIGDVHRQWWREAKKVIKERRVSGGETRVTLRAYLSANLNLVEVQYSGAVKTFSAEDNGLIISAGFKDIVNKNVMFDRYTALNSPGLKYT